MKVFYNHPVVKPAGVEKSIRQQAGDQGFGAILKETVEKTKEEAPVQRLAGVVPLSGIQMNRLQDIEKGSVMKRIEKFLDMIDGYRRNLGNPKVTLRELNPLVEKMQAEKERLTPILDALPEGDALKGILNQALVTSSLEVLKFKRGDYI